MDEIRKGLYRHYNGGYYRVICLAQHTETGEELVVYKSLKDEKLWVRPKIMFLEKVVVEGKEVPRFLYQE